MNSTRAKWWCVSRTQTSTSNFKDALAATGKGRILRRASCIGGIDLSGTVVSSSDARFAKGDAVLAVGHDLGVAHHGGYAEYARVPANWAVKLPRGMTLWARTLTIREHSFDYAEYCAPTPGGFYDIYRKRWLEITHASRRHYTRRTGSNSLPGGTCGRRRLIGCHGRPAGSPRNPRPRAPYLPAKPDRSMEPRSRGGPGRVGASHPPRQ